jgi:hypothetical protein
MNQALYAHMNNKRKMKKIKKIKTARHWHTQGPLFVSCYKLK